jgi:acyl-CoA thioester hydrolase
MAPSSSTRLRVRYAEVDRLGAVNSSRYFEWFELGRSDLLRDLGLPYSGLEESGVMLPVVEAGCTYIAKLGYDELLRLETTLEVLSPVRLRFHFQVFRTDDTGELLAAEGFTEHAVVGPSGKPARLSGDVLARLGGRPS